MIDFLLSPLTWLLLALIVVWRARRNGTLRRFAGLAVVFSLVLITPLGANLLVHAVESQLSPDPACAVDMPPTVVVLAGGFDRPPRDATDVIALSGATLRRVLAGTTLFEHVAATRLVLSGGDGRAATEGGLMARLAEELGVAPAAIEVEQSSHTTWQNAAALAAHSPALPKRFWLVSSALHLPRALIAFRAAGFEPCAVSSESRYVPPGDIGYYLPHSSSLRKSEMAVHEIVGGVFYGLRAWRASPPGANGISGTDAAMTP